MRTPRGEPTTAGNRVRESAGPAARARRIGLALAIGLLVVAGARIAGARDEHVAEAQAQVHSVVGALIDSEAETAQGAYVPGVGAVFTLDLVRGPNSTDGLPSYAGVHDWMIYLMRTFGAKLDAVPSSETIAMVVTYYDYPTNSYHTMTMSSPASGIGDPAGYAIWLDAAPYAQATGQAPVTAATNTPAPAQPAAVATVTAAATAIPAAPTATAVPGGPISVQANFDADGALDRWKPVSGTWVRGNGTYDQTNLGQFDLVSYYDQPILGNYRISADVKFVDGQMGAGLVFNANADASKKGAQMVSFAGNGTYIQWGYFDDSGVFQYVGGRTIVSTQDGAWHSLAVDVTGDVFQVTLDNVVIGSNIPLQHAAGGYAGLLASTSKISFDNVLITSLPS